jgi:hypothetical protein
MVLFLENIAPWVFLASALFLCYKAYNNLQMPERKRTFADFAFLIFYPKKYFNKDGLFFRRMLWIIATTAILIGIFCAEVAG